MSSKRVFACATHGKFTPKGLLPPLLKDKTLNPCAGCHTAYAQWMFAKFTRRAKGGGQSSKQKGRAAVLLVADLLRKAFRWEQDDALVKATSMIGVDLHLSPRAQRDFPFAIEAKNVEKLNIWDALSQAAANAGGKTPIVFFKRANSQLYVALAADDFLRALHAPGVDDTHADTPGTGT
jgi:hypothetical protein